MDLYMALVPISIPYTTKGPLYMSPCPHDKGHRVASAKCIECPSFIRNDAKHKVLQCLGIRENRNGANT